MGYLPDANSFLWHWMVTDKLDPVGWSSSFQHGALELGWNNNNDENDNNHNNNNNNNSSIYTYIYIYNDDDDDGNSNSNNVPMVISSIFQLRQPHHHTPPIFWCLRLKRYLRRWGPPRSEFAGVNWAPLILNTFKYHPNETIEGIGFVRICSCHWVQFREYLDGIT